MPAGMKDIPLTPPEGVTSVGQLRTYMKESQLVGQIEEAKIDYQAASADFKPTDTDRPGSFDEWMRQGDQIKKYGKAYTAWKNQQRKAQQSRFASPPTDRAGQQMMQSQVCFWHCLIL